MPTCDVTKKINGNGRSPEDRIKGCTKQRTGRLTRNSADTNTGRIPLTGKLPACFYRISELLQATIVLPQFIVATVYPSNPGCVTVLHIIL